MPDLRTAPAPFRSALTGLVLTLLLSALGACATRDIAQDKPARSEQYSSRVWVLRHKVYLDIPGLDISQRFDGMMRLDMDKDLIHVVGLGGLGMRLFDLTLSAGAGQIAYLHPVLEKVPDAGAKISECIGNIWFDYLSQIQLKKLVQFDGWRVVRSGNLVAGLWPEYVTYTDTRIPY
ncbi:MAG: hypothetical protein LBN33_09680, partial [Desulfovibrio sp.]|nr:hypothetical protein [Desulfovibrio sp.]